MFRFLPRPSLLPVLLTFILASACAPQTTPTPFRPPTQLAPTQLLATTTPVPALFTSVPITPTLTITPTVPGPCTNNLSFLSDITIEDNTSVLPNETIDKQWLVENSGTCNWDSTYRLKWIGGDPMGAEQEQMIFPAHAGAKVTLRILFTAPSAEGPYESAWQAYSPDGSAFGDPIFIKIIVSQ